MTNFSTTPVALAHIESLDHEGRGVAHVDGKAVFIEGALPRELVQYQPSRKKKNFETAKLVKILRASCERIAPRCNFYEICGGCVMQHVDPSLQVAAKQRVLEDNLARVWEFQTPFFTIPECIRCRAGGQRRAHPRKPRRLLGIAHNLGGHRACVPPYPSDDARSDRTPPSALSQPSPDLPLKPPATELPARPVRAGVAARPAQDG